MKHSLLNKLDNLSTRYEELQGLMSSPEVINDQNLFRDYSKEYAQLEPIVQSFTAYSAALNAFNDNKELLQDESDKELKALIIDENIELETQLQTLETELQILLLPKDPDDTRNVYCEVRAGTGGDEAAIFSGDLYRMYVRYAESRGWQVEIVNSNEGDHGGFKEIILKISGTDVYASLKFESGAHRVQRVPDTESQGRIHTSACTVAIMPEVETVDEIEIKSEELRIDTYRASGAGGQHVNKTDSAIRITHIPTGTVVECQEERSQHKNRAKALSLLQSRLLSEEQGRQRKEQADTRKSLVGSGDRSERIRTYNYPQGRVTDHRINLTLYKLDEIMQGSLSMVIEPLVREHQAELLTSLNEQ